ncbi:uncharacterized protein LOC133791499 [Humulus lupulus]|uniref:uncharacterized protein LOC133791499 n=1 Tax=Humulus lupulus TaxID=3486 RepID=UPI002B407E49|nr:uncharacterized protein LOC133791499 [Humulus lupulus]
MYGRNTVEERQDLWQALALLNFPMKPWLLAGDFNAAFDFDDRIGGCAVTELEMEDAQRCRALGMVDALHIIGSHYTWSNKQEAEARIFSKLDRVFKNEDWVDLFPQFEALTNWDILSDHCYCIIKSMHDSISGIKPFRFYNMWAEHTDFRDTVPNSWSKPLHAHGLVRIMQKLDRLKHVLHRFNKREVGDVIHNYSAARDHYQNAQCNLQQNPHSAELQLAERTACLDFSRQYRIYESFLRQRRKITWLCFGDKNSTHFHASLKQRKAANRITSFLDDKGQINDKFEDVVAHFLNHFRSIMGSPSSTSSQIQKDCFIHGDTLSLDYQLSLLKPFTKKDVKIALLRARVLMDLARASLK